MRLNVVERNGLLLPGKLAVETGLGCPKCDDSCLVPTALGQASPLIQAFLKKHLACGKLETLEQLANGELGITGQFP